MIDLLDAVDTEIMLKANEELANRQVIEFSSPLEEKVVRTLYNMECCTYVGSLLGFLDELFEDKDFLNKESVIALNNVLIDYEKAGIIKYRRNRRIKVIQLTAEAVCAIAFCGGLR